MKGGAIFTLALLGIASRAWADDPCHFVRSKVAPDEARILALSGVSPEWKCDYALSPLTGGKWNNTFVLFAEMYHGTTCAARWRLALPVMDPALPLKGIISIGWKDAGHQLTGVVDNGQLYSPWTYGAIPLADFSPIDGHFFDPSLPEARKSEVLGASDFVVFPVLGLRGNSSLKANLSEARNTVDFLKICEMSHSASALILYVYKGPADPPIHFQPNP